MIFTDEAIRAADPDPSGPFSFGTQEDWITTAQYLSHRLMKAEAVCLNAGMWLDNPDATHSGRLYESVQKWREAKNEG